MKRMMRIMAGVTLSAFLLMTCSCSRFTSETSKTTVTSDSEQVTDISSGPEEKEISEFIMFSTFYGMDSAADGDIKTMIAEKTGVLINELFMNGTGWNLETLYDDMLARPDESIPDLIYTNVNAHKIYEHGRAVAWDQYLELYPDLKALHTDEEWDKLRQDDGHIYWVDFEDCFNGKDTTVTPEGESFWIQVRVLEWAGYPKIETPDEYFDLLERYAEANPYLPDGTEVIPYLCRNSTDLGKPAMYLDGYPDDGIAEVNAGSGSGVPQVIDYTTSDTSRYYFSKLNEEYKKGIICPGLEDQSLDSYLDLIGSGRALGLFDDYNTIDVYTDLYGKPRIDENGSKFYLTKLGYDYVPLGLVKDPGTAQHYHSYNVMNADSGLVVLDKCSDPDTLFGFFNDLLDQEIMDLRFWGIEGVDYLVDENGLFYRTEEMRANWSDDLYLTTHTCRYPGLPHLHGMREDGINRMIADEQPSEFKATLPEPVAKCLDAYGADNIVDFLGSEYRDPYPWYPLSSLTDTALENKTDPALWNSIKDFKVSSLAQLVTADDFDKSWETFVSSYNEYGPEVIYDALQEEVEAVINGN